MKTLKVSALTLALLFSIPSIANADTTVTPSPTNSAAPSASPSASKSASSKPSSTPKATKTAIESPAASPSSKVTYSSEAKAAYKQAVEMAKSRFQLAVSDATAQLQEDIKAAGTNIAAIKAARAKYNLNYKQAFKAMADYIASAKQALENSITK